MLRKYNVCLNDNTKSFDVMLPEQRQFDVFLQGSYVQREFDVFLQGSQVHGNIFISALPSLHNISGHAKIVLDANTNIEKSICFAIENAIHICSYLSNIQVESPVQILSDFAMASEATILVIADIGQIHAGTVLQTSQPLLSADVHIQAYNEFNTQIVCDASIVTLRKVYELRDVYIDDMDMQSLRDIDYITV